MKQLSVALLLFSTVFSALEPSFATSSSSGHGKVPKLSPAGLKALDDLVANTVKSNRLPGFVLAVSNVDEQLYANAGGNQTYGDPNSAVATTDSVFWLASMTRLLTSISVLQLVEQGKFNFDTPVSKFFPEFKNVVLLHNVTDPASTFEPVKKPITVWHLLTHTSGLSYFLGPPRQNYESSVPYTHKYAEGEGHSKFLELLKFGFPGIAVASHPGTAFTYGHSTTVLGLVVEKVTGQSLEEYAQKNLFSSVGVNTSYRLTEETNSRLIDLHFRNPDGSISGWEDRAPVIQRYPEQVRVTLGGVGAYSTLPDYLTILRHLLQIEAGRNVRNAVLKRKTVQELFKPQLKSDVTLGLEQLLDLISPNINFENPNWSTTFAVTTKDLRGGRPKGSGFWSGFAGTWYIIDPKTGIALVFGSQIVPPLDPVTAEVVEEAERIVYANLEY
ncbi:beta-lactamase/transpeptidase-like protein [Coprinopsis marcescibilis]|uniref:Beta-lactamase/transpeptidase-like protein n=1 Tax=Coprinopsis marcescibilis TaxID=230819 RepID=A0A5C3L739_COPMA|nr:beta-lactamase/transpeptidase-like protein [Coprinopsis marcescibilis]